MSLTEVSAGGPEPDALRPDALRPDALRPDADGSPPDGSAPADRGGAAGDVVGTPALPRRVVLPARPRPPRAHLRPGWPVVAMLAGYPLWWVLGLSSLIYPILALPMVVHLYRRRPIRLPPGFGIWLLYLLWQVLGIAALGVDPVGTVADTFSGRLVAVVVRFSTYVAVTILLLYVGNLREDELPRRRLVALLAWMFALTVAGGLASIAAPTFNFTAPLEYVLPPGARGNEYVKSLVHPALSQVQDVLGYASPRPKAPFEYTNSWGSNFALLGVMFVVAVLSGVVVRRTAARWAVLVVGLAAAIVPGVYSLNRAMWIAVALALPYVAIRMALRRRYSGLVAVGAVIAVVAVAVVATPLQGVVTGRLDNGRSNDIRASLLDLTITLTNQSPVIGYGSTRVREGGTVSIAVGRSPSCPFCGNASVGSTGQVWQSMMTSGYVGAGLYMLFFLSLMWRYRRDGSAIGIGGTLVLGMAPFFALFYSAFSSPLVFFFLVVGLLWRNELDTPDLGRASPPGRTALPDGSRPAVEVAP